MLPIVIMTLWLVAGICLHAGVSHVLIGLRQPRAYTHVLFGFQCLLSVGAMIATAQLYRAAGVEEYLRSYAYVNAFVIPFFICMPWFIVGSTVTRVRWPAWLISAIYLTILIAEVSLPYGMFKAPPILRPMLLPWGESVTAHTATPNLLLNAFWITHVLLYAYAFWACREQYRRGQRRQAVMLFVSVMPFAVALAVNISIGLGLLRFVFVGPVGFFATVLLMSWTLSREMHHTRERSQAILDNVPAVTWIKDLDSRYLFVNKYYERVFGKRSNDIIGRSDHELFPASLAESWVASDRHALRTNSSVDVEEQMTVGGQQRTVLTLKFPLRDAKGVPYALGGVSTDITDNKRTSDAMRALAQSANAEDSETFLRECAQQLAKTYGADHAFIALYEDDGDTLHRFVSWPTQEQRSQERLTQEVSVCREVLEHGRCHVESDARGRYPQDSLLAGFRAEGLLAAPLVSISQRTMGVIGVTSATRLGISPAATDLLDVFARRIALELDRIAAVDALQSLAAELEQRVSERTRELEAFSYSVSHDLRTPLRAIDGHSSLLTESLATADEATSRDRLRRIREAVKRMAELIDDLLELAKVARQELRTEHVDLTALINQTLARLREQEPARQADIHVAADMKTFGDPRLLSVVVDNLLGNAWKYTGRTEHACIEAGAAEVAGTRAFFVKDNGVGFDPTHADKLFQAFQRLHDAASFSGTGVGLAIVARIIERHNGKVWAESSPGKGAIFYFTLPEQERSGRTKLRATRGAADG
jgi:PAS domain S-box-containing protein